MTSSEFLTALESGSRPLRHRADLGVLLDQASRGNAQAFLDAAFHAKFVIKTRDVMRRIGKDADGFDKLSAEFQASLQKVSSQVKSLVERAPAAQRTAFEGRYLSLDPDSLERLLELCDDLARVKNWEVDGKPLPFTSPDAGQSPASSKPASLRGVLRTTRLALALFVALLIIDPPVSITGWIVAFVIVGLFILVEFEAAHAPHEPGT